MIQTTLFYPIAILAILIVGISKSGFGGGLGVLAVPLMSLVIPPPQAAAILLPLLILMDWFTVWHYRKSWDRRNLIILLPAAIVGIFLASLFFRYLTDAHIRILVGVLAILFVAIYFLKRQNTRSHAADIPRGLLWGSIAGFTSFGVHAGGPPVNIYLLPQQLNKSIFVGTTVLFFTIINLVKVVPYALLGQFSTGNLLISLFLAPLTPLGVLLGVKLHHRVNEKLFYNLCYLFLFITGIKLLIDGIRG
ncbi:sulfite exporter TauE/SafE family protein [candidate division KSB1 bacterium]|nr:sulfite exporter TauE/SafE family protein [candidate division KSB1 bacterium]RQW04183.1 MAG: sulfite exporter TauE/SafE family protein [candidate division KSB1 bacterium]